MNLLHAVEFDEHLGRERGVAVPELNELVVTILQALSPVRPALAIFDLLRLGRDLSEKLLLQIE